MRDEKEFAKFKLEKATAALLEQLIANHGLVDKVSQTKLRMQIMTNLGRLERNAPIRAGRIKKKLETWAAQDLKRQAVARRPKPRRPVK
ncbi:MAG: hypothetical protein QGI60_02790 [archaeon]|jgi:hypothetical protein|nr:hypothetical protein [archaeon]